MNHSSDKIDFKEFTVTLWSFLTIGVDSLTAFTFSLYDTNGNGILSGNEIEQMFLSIYGKDYLKNPQVVRYVNRVW